MSDPAAPVPGRRASGRTPGRAAALAAGLALGLLAAGCGEEPRDSITLSAINVAAAYAPDMLRPGRLVVEPHNGPFPDAAAPVDAAAVAGLLALPSSLPDAGDMPQVAPGGWARAEHGRLLRIAVIFDPTEQVAFDALCDARAPLTADEGRPQGFEATMALCLRGEAIAEGRVSADAADPPTPEFVARALNELLAEMLGAGGAD